MSLDGWLRRRLSETDPASLGALRVISSGPNYKGIVESYERHLAAMRKLDKMTSEAPKGPQGMEFKKTFTSTELKNLSGQVIEAALKAPTALSKNGRVVLVILSLEEYEGLLKNAHKSGEEIGPGVKEYD